MTPQIGNAPVPESDRGGWKKRIVWTLAIIVGVLASLWAISAAVDLTIWGAYNHFIDNLRDHLGLNTYLANVLSLVFIVPFFVGVKHYLFSLRKRGRMAGLALLLSIGVVYNLFLYFGTKTEHFDANGRAVKFYALIPGGVVFSDRPGTEREYGVPFRPVSSENIRWLLRIQQGRIQAVSDPAAHAWFDQVTGDPLLWYYADSDGNLHFFDGPGRAPDTGTELKPVTPELRQDWEKKVKTKAAADAARKEEEAAVDAARKAEEAAAVALREAERVEFDIEPNSIHAGERATLRWKTAVTSVRLQALGSGEIGSFSGQGSYEVAPTADTTYELVANGPAGEETVRTSITVLPPLAPALRVSTQPQQIWLGQSARIVWSSENSTGVQVAGVGDFGPSGSVTVRPSTIGTTTYLVMSSGPGGKSQQEVHIAVMAPPKPRMVVLGLDDASGVQDRRALDQLVSGRLVSFFGNKFDIIEGPIPHAQRQSYLDQLRQNRIASSSPPEYLSCVTLRARAENKQRDLIVAATLRREVNVDATVFVIRTADGSVVGEGHGAAKKSATLAWQTASPALSGQSSNPDARLESETATLAIANALKGYREIASR